MALPREFTRIIGDLAGDVMCVVANCH